MEEKNKKKSPNKTKQQKIETLYFTLDIKIPKPDSLPPAIVKPRGISLEERSYKNKRT